MKRTILLFQLLFVVIISIQSQQRGIQGDYDTSHFPEISFIWNDANPQTLEKSQISIIENNIVMPFNFEPLSHDKGSKNSSIIFLWEDMAIHSGQYTFFKNILYRFFNETTLNNNDKFNIAVFNRKEDNKNLLTPLSKEFTNNKKTLLQIIQNYQASQKYYNEFPKQSDLYLSISEGINLLKNEPINNNCIIVIFTAGLNIKASGASTEMETVRQKALESNIPVYVVKYPLFGDTPEINTLSEYTYGEHISTNNTETSLTKLQEFYYRFDKRSSGIDYRITFTTNEQRDGKPHQIHLTLDKVPQQIPAFNAPEQTTWDWISEHKFLCVFIMLVIIAIITTAIIIINKKIKERNIKHLESETKLRNEISASNQAIEYLKKEQIERNKIEEDKITRQALEEKAKLMYIKNLYPRLQYTYRNENYIYNIDKPITTIGREPDNDIKSNDVKVSRHHAQIEFVGDGFEIVDLGSTNKVIVNGSFYDRTRLKSGDVIGLGETVIIFHI